MKKNLFEQIKNEKYKLNSSIIDKHNNKLSCIMNKTLIYNPLNYKSIYCNKCNLFICEGCRYICHKQCFELSNSTGNIIFFDQEYFESNTLDFPCSCSINNHLKISKVVTKSIEMQIISKKCKLNQILEVTDGIDLDKLLKLVFYDNKNNCAICSFCLFYEKKDNDLKQNEDEYIKFSNFSKLIDFIAMQNIGVEKEIYKICSKFNCNYSVNKFHNSETLEYNELEHLHFVLMNISTNEIDYYFDKEYLVYIIMKNVYESSTEFKRIETAIRNRSIDSFMDTRMITILSVLLEIVKLNNQTFYFELKEPKLYNIFNLIDENFVIYIMNLEVNYKNFSIKRIFLLLYIRKISKENISSYSKDFLTMLLLNKTTLNDICSIKESINLEIFNTMCENIKDYFKLNANNESNELVDILLDYSSYLFDKSRVIMMNLVDIKILYDKIFESLLKINIYLNPGKIVEISENTNFRSSNNYISINFNYKKLSLLIEQYILLERDLSLLNYLKDNHLSNNDEIQKTLFSNSENEMYLFSIGRDDLLTNMISLYTTNKPNFKVDRLIDIFIDFNNKSQYNFNDTDFEAKFRNKTFLIELFSLNKEISLESISADLNLKALVKENYSDEYQYYSHSAILKFLLENYDAISKMNNANKVLLVNKGIFDMILRLLEMKILDDKLLIIFV
jgi:hypothetical protein